MRVIKYIKWLVVGLLASYSLTIPASDTLPHKLTSSTLDSSVNWNNRELALIDSLRLSSLPSIPSSPSNQYANNKLAAYLGEKIFNDTRFSQNGQVSCATCHKSEYNFTDDKPVAIGVGTTNRRSMPTVGMAYQHWYFWDGRADSLWSQTLGPLENPLEHGISRTKVAQLIQQHYSTQYQTIVGSQLGDFSLFSSAAMPNELNTKNSQAWMSIREDNREEITLVFVNTGKFLEAFLRTINPQQSPFDSYADQLLDSDNNLKENPFLSAKQIQGLKLFIGKGSCINCHNGPMLSNGEFHHAGTPTRDKIDLGRADVLLQIADNEFGCMSQWSDNTNPNDCLHVRFLNKRVDIMEQAFKTPSLRNVATRPPYMHAGQFKTLDEVLKNYQKIANTSPLTDELFHGELSDLDLEYLEAFLHTLTTD
ncbi:Di-heme cytochrome c peroxidase family protein [Vibrio chagasii]|uniref:cytochrome-c peroxidase n=1 Tax=Vibrio TaxID=662 RepID=UPI000637EB34|nr:MULTISPECIES: cytochrome c peroxidase [Vibrio]CAH7020803.1 Di-heme cytochrome c peroxidase family protein [Vibrio chagasii]CAH7293529.1 Di-heme cytochrome c peroxidase family protein [Vibrio chagasii]CDT12316.1 Di-heme cytochrome c peroxidase family protein [Vibrio coralliirubri]CDT31046.1 Di-heme cytochrome c peroxidase family protein [Vibrio coralliirubri]CDT48774.1 Di-heme cytochrome c peroxidase family protein [Vibrio coralliirubri]